MSKKVNTESLKPHNTGLNNVETIRTMLCEERAQYICKQYRLMSACADCAG